jgi:hypothetical protein
VAKRHGSGVSPEVHAVPAAPGLIIHDILKMELFIKKPPRHYPHRFAP